MSTPVEKKSVEPSKCPTCGAAVDAATNLYEEDVRPKEGDFAVCIECAAINQYDARGGLVPSSPEALRVLSREQRLLVERAQWYIRDQRAEKGFEKPPA